MGGLGMGNAALIVLQLTLASVITVLLNDIIEKGYGVGGSGISLFIATNICTDIFWKVLGPLSVNVYGKPEFVGILPEIPKTFVQIGKAPSKAVPLLRRLLWDRGPGMSTISGLFATAAVAVIVTYFFAWFVEVPLHRKGARVSVPTRPYKVRLLYNHSMPLVLMSALVGNLYIISQSLYATRPRYAMVKMLGVWKPVAENASNMIPVGGLSYYVSAPRSIAHCLSDPIHSLVYLGFTLAASAFLSLSWLEVSGSGAREVAVQLQVHASIYTHIC
jgi:protein transport protein SEC61 subunit alpha